MYLLAAMFQPRIAVRYSMFRICVLRISHLEPYRTSIPYFISIFKAYHTHIITKKAYRNSVPYFLAKIDVYHTVLTYQPAILAFCYEQLLLIFKSLAYKLAISIHAFSVGFSCLLPLHTKSLRNKRKVWDF